MADTKRDYYEVLGVDKGAGEQDIKKQYRILAKKYHPDLNPGDKQAEKNFKELNEAYEVLSDPDKRARYDQFGHAAFDPKQGGGPDGYGGFGGFGGGFSDFGDLGSIFESFFGGGFSQSARPNAPRRGDDIRTVLSITFEEACFGVKKRVTYSRVEKCNACDGSGAAEGTSPETCRTCGGTGRVKTAQRTPFGMVQTQGTCSDCHGKGKTVKNPCKTCQGAGYVRRQTTLDVEVPAGIDDGQTIRIQAQGNNGINGGRAGDLLVSINVRPSGIFEREGFDLYMDLPITFVQAALGAEVTVLTIDGKVKYKIPESTQTGTVFRLAGKGVTKLHKSTRGDLFVRVVVSTPTKLTDSQKELLRQFEAGFYSDEQKAATQKADAKKADGSDGKKGFFGKKK